MASFLTALELATYLQGTTDPADLPLEWIAQANALIESISDDVELDAGVRLEAGTGTVVLAGTNSRDLILPAGPVRDITSVSLDGDLLAAGAWYWNDRALIRRGWEPFDDDPEGPIGGIRQGARSRDGYPWGSPASTVIVSYSWGYTIVPPFVRSLVKRIAARTIGNMEDVSQESLGAYSVSHRSTAGAGSHLKPDEVLRLRKALGAGVNGTVTFAGR